MSKEKLTAREYLAANVEQSNIPSEHYEWEIAEMMQDYSDYIKQSEPKDNDVEGVALELYPVNVVHRGMMHFDGNEEERKAFIKGYNHNTAELSKTTAIEYAKFCVACERKGMPLLELEGFLKLK